MLFIAYGPISAHVALKICLETLFSKLVTAEDRQCHCERQFSTAKYNCLRPVLIPKKEGQGEWPLLVECRCSARSMIVSRTSKEGRKE